MFTPFGADPEQLKNAVGGILLAVVVVDGLGVVAVVVDLFCVVVDVLAIVAAWVVDVLDEVALFFLLPHAIPAAITTTTSAMAVQNHHRLNTGFLP